MINNKEFNLFSKELMSSLENSDIKTHNKTKHIIVSPRCFKKSLMMLRTDKSEQIKDYYLDLEEMFKMYLKYQSDYNINIMNNQLKLKDEELLEEKRKNNDHVQMFIQSNLLVMMEYVYIATSKNYAKLNIFKIGKTKSFQTRIHGYNTGRDSDDAFYYVYIMKCVDCTSLENMIFSRLKNFKYIDRYGKERNEMYRIHYDYIVKIINEFNTFEQLNIVNLNNIYTEYYSVYNDIQYKSFDEIKIDNFEEYIKDEFDDNYESRSELTIRLYGDSENKSKLTNIIINEKLNPFGLEIVNEYTGNCIEQQTFKCDSIFNHVFKVTWDHINEEKSKGCPMCRKHNILEGIKIYEYKKLDYSFTNEYKSFEELKKSKSNINHQLIRNNIREQRWLCSIGEFIYSILAPDENSKLNLKKELNVIELKIIEILEIDYNHMSEKLLLNYASFIYAIDNTNKIIYKGTNATIISKQLKYVNKPNFVNRKTIPKYVNKPTKQYAGYYWTTELTDDFGYKIITLN